MKRWQVRCLLLSVAVATVCPVGCAAHRTGEITVSHPRVWHGDAIIAATGRQLKAAEDFGQQAGLFAAQGRRLRSAMRAVKFGLTLEPAVSSPGAPAEGGSGGSEGTGGATHLLPSTGQIAPMTAEELAKLAVGIVEDPTDGLQRVDDFQYELNGVRLTHLRDTASLSEGWSLYLLGFDISLLPEDQTATDHGALVEFIIEGQPDDVRVYGVWPQRYADRFEEALSVREDLGLALTEQAARHGVSGKAWQELAQRYEDTLALLQRYPLISGFINGRHSFGWEFSPRLRIVTRKHWWILPDRAGERAALEPGIRHCYALLLVRDDRIEAPKRLVKLSSDDLRAISEGSQAAGMDRGRLVREYRNLLAELPDDGDWKDTKKYLQDDLEQLERALDEGAGKKGADLAGELGFFHKRMMCLRGRQGDGGTTELTLRVRRHWFHRVKGHPIKPHSGLLSARPGTMTVKLPDKLDRTLENIWAVWPDSGPARAKTVVTIRGQNFSNDARVFVGGKEAEDVSVVGRDFIVATFPGLDEELEEDGEKAVRVKVVTGGDSLTAADVFTYRNVTIVGPDKNAAESADRPPPATQPGPSEPSEGEGSG